MKILKYNRFMLHSFSAMKSTQHAVLLMWFCIFLVREILVCIVMFISRMVCGSICIKVYIRCRYNTRKLADIGCHAVPYQTPVQNTVTSMAFAQHNIIFDLLTKKRGREEGQFRLCIAQSRSRIYIADKLF